MEYEIKTDRQTIWINGSTGLLGRFNKRFSDVHGQDSTCCNCGPTRTANIKLAWDNFKDEMKKNHGISVSDEDAPDSVAAEL